MSITTFPLVRSGREVDDKPWQLVTGGANVKFSLLLGDLGLCFPPALQAIGKLLDRRQGGDFRVTAQGKRFHCCGHRDPVNLPLLGFALYMNSNSLVREQAEALLRG